MTDDADDLFVRRVDTLMRVATLAAVVLAIVSVLAAVVGLLAGVVFMLRALL